MKRLVPAMLAGALAGLADVASTVLWLSSGRDQWRLVLSLVSLAAFATSLAYLLWVGFDALLSRLRVAPWLRRGVFLALPLGLTAHWLFEGGKMRRLPAQWVLQPLAAALLVAASLALWEALARGAARLADASPRRRAIAIAAGVAAGLALHGLDHRILPRLYEYLHAGLGVLTAVAFFVALSNVAALSRVRRGVALAAFVLVSVAGLFSFDRLESWPNVRAEVFGVHSPFVRHIAVVATHLAGAGDDGLSAQSLAHARARRRRAAQARVAGLPVVEGAHVLLLSVDALRGDRVGRGLMPFVDSLAQAGVHFERTYTQAPHSSYSLSSLHTGEYLHETIPLGQAQPLPTLAGQFREAGWSTAALYTRGIFFTEGERLTSYRDSDYGFARAAHVDRYAEAQAAAARSEIDDVVRRHEPPSLLWVHFFDAHAPYQGSGATPEAQYDAAARTVDDAIRNVVGYARQRYRRPIVIAITADHGEEFYEHGAVYHGSSLYEEQVRVPWVLVAPGLAARRVGAPAQLVDLAPTLLALAGLEAPATMHGRDLRAAMVAPRDDLQQPVFSAVNSRKMVVKWPWKLITDVMFGVSELYNLEADPHEHHNLASEEPDRVRELRADIGVWLEELTARTGDTSPLARARLGDRTVIEPLVALARNAEAPQAQRIEAITLLARFGRRDLRTSLRPLLDDPLPAVADEAAIALGSARNPEAIPRLLTLVSADPRERRWRAARALCRMRNNGGLDAMLEGLWAEDEETRNETLLCLIELGDPRAVEALLAVLPDDHVRYRVLLALGRTRDPRAFEAIVERALHDPTDDARGNAVAALGALGDRRAIAHLSAMVSRDRAEPYAVEALGALGAIGREVVGFEARSHLGRAPQGFARCDEHDDVWGFTYLHASSCESAPGVSAVALGFSLPAGERLLVLRLRAMAPGEHPVAVRAAGREIARITVGPRWHEHRIALTRAPAGPVSLDLAPERQAPPAVRVDHAALFPLQ